MVDLSNFFQVNASIQVGGVTTQGFGRGLVLTIDESLSAKGNGKVRYFTDYEQVVAFFASDSEATKAAAEWFGQDPYPQGLYIGRWAYEDIQTVLRGAVFASTSSSALSALKTSDASVRVANVDVSVDTSSATSFAGVARILQEAFTAGVFTGRVASITIDTTGSGLGNDPDNLTVSIDNSGTGGSGLEIAPVLSGGALQSVTIVNAGQGYESAPAITFTHNSGTVPTVTAVLETRALSPELEGCTFTFSNSQFILQLNGGDILDPPYFESAATGTDLSSLLGLDVISEPTYIQGSDEESPSQAITSILDLISQTPTYLMLANDVPLTFSDNDLETIVALWTFAEAGDYIFSFTDTSETARQAVDETSLLARAHAAQLQNTMVCVGDAGREPHRAALAKLSSINWDQPTSIITLFGKSLSTIQPTAFSETEYRNLVAKRANIYTEIGHLPTFAEGFAARAGHWIDAVAFLQWLKGETERQIWNSLRASRRLTIAVLKASLDEAMRKGVINGGLQPGRRVGNVTKADIIQTTGNQNFDGQLTAGYLIHVGALASQSQADIDARKAPPIKIWAVGSEAIHMANIDIVFSN